MSIFSAGINFGKPNTEIIVESDESGVVQSCRNVDTGVEYVGGGGGGDFTTAEVTVINTAEYSSGFKCAIISDNEPLPESSASLGEYTAPANQTSTFTVVKYKNQALIYIEEDVVALSGDITEIANGYYLITGDCTITTE